MITKKVIDGVPHAVMPNGHAFKKDDYLLIKEAFKKVIMESDDILKDKAFQTVIKDKLIAEGIVVDPAKLPSVERSPRSSMTVLENGTDYKTHMEQEVKAAIDKFPPSRGGGVFLSSEHVELQATINGSVFIFPDKVIDMVSALKMALRTNKPLTNKMMSMSMALIVEIKEEPGDE
jgi:hypothetical protein